MLIMNGTGRSAVLDHEFTDQTRDFPSPSIWLSPYSYRRVMHRCYFTSH